MRPSWSSRGRLGGLPDPIEAEGIWTAIWYQEAHNSTALEGNTLILRQVEVLLRDGRAVGDKALNEYLEVRGYADAARWVYGQALEPGAWSDGSLLTLSEVRNVHKLALGPVWDVAPHPGASEREDPGSFREHDIAPFGGGMAPRHGRTFPPRCATGCERLRGSPGLSGRSRPWLGCTARLNRSTRFSTATAGPADCCSTSSWSDSATCPRSSTCATATRYLRALRSNDSGDPGPLGELLARAVLDNLYRFVVPAIAGPRRLVPLPALADRHLSEGALRVAANRGRLRARRGPTATGGAPVPGSTSTSRADISDTCEPLRVGSAARLSGPVCPDGGEGRGERRGRLRPTRQRG